MLSEGCLAVEAARGCPKGEVPQLITDGCRFDEGDDNEVFAVLVSPPTFGVGAGMFQCHAQQAVFRTVDLVEA